MSFNGSGTFVINSAGEPPVSGTAITVAAHTALTADLATGLSTCITKDGQTVATAEIDFAQGLTATTITATSVNVTTLNAGAIFNNTGLASNTYSPALTNVTNVDGSTTATCYYLRLGTIIYVAGVIAVDPTAAGGAATEVDIALPIPSNLGATGDLVGACQSNDSAIVEFGHINPDTANDRAKLQFNAASAANHGIAFWFFYSVI